MSNTLRLLMPQWQGGNNPPYSFGARLLAWLAPSNDNDAFIEVSVEPYNGAELEKEDGIVARSALLKQLRSAKQMIEEQQPDKVIVFGGDCLVSQAPFAYLNKKYDGKLGVLWLDAHPDVSTPKIYPHAHAMVLGNLLGEGDAEFAAEVGVPIEPNQVMFAGLRETTPEEKLILDRLDIRKASPKELAENSDLIIDWMEKNQIKHLAVHLDLDVLDPQLFRSLLFANPDGTKINAAQGEMTFAQLSRIFEDISKQADIVGLGIAEHLPWDAMNLKEFLEDISIFK